ncbi:GNAT family N-acetyltransferase [Nostoc sp. CCCryo 231-06]|nr:GNAT family N-acetyltransferase [Nostoc sp. CCCryo 231-06]
MTILLETERLIIRSWIPEGDAEQAFAIYNDPEVTHFLGKASRPASVESQRQRLIEGIERCLRRAMTLSTRQRASLRDATRSKIPVGIRYRRRSEATMVLDRMAIVEKETTTIE